MQLFTHEQPIYLPENGQESVLRLGLQPMPTSLWMMVDSDFQVFQQHKVAIKSNHGDKVYAALACSKPAQMEFHGMLLGHLVSHHSSHFSQQDNCLTFAQGEFAWDLSDQSLWESSLWVQEDICLMERLNGQYVLTAGSVCSPSNWYLEEKIGKPMDEIHSPVPGYQNKLSSRVNRLLDKLSVEKPMLRYNWSVQSGNELYWRDDVADESSDLEKFWRVERQTLRRLPKTGAIVFTIRIYLHSFAQLQADKMVARDLKLLLAQLSVDEKQYKGL